MSVAPASFIRFVYPFLFDPEEFDRRVECVESGACGSLGRLWEREAFPEQDVLHHVAQYLNPPPGVSPTARLWRVTPIALQSPQGIGGGPPGQGAEWYFVRGDQQIGFCIEDVQLILFRVGVGFVTLRVRPQTDDLPTWLDFLHYFRFLRRKDLCLHARRRTGIDAQRQPVYADYFPELAGGGAGNSARNRTTGDLVEALLRTADAEPAGGPWWREVFIAGQFLPYAVLMAEGCTGDEQPRLLYKVHNFFHSSQGEHPAPEELRIDQEHLLPYAQRQWFVFSLDGAGFVGFDLPQTEFFRTTLPDHLDDHYLLAYLLALHQRFALMSFSDEVSRNWLPHGAPNDGPGHDRREGTFRAIRDRFLQFTARGYFAQVMQRRHHHRCYAKWQEMFQIDRLFHEVGQEVREMHDYLLMRRTEHIEQLAEDTQRLELRLNKLAAFFVPPALALAFLDAVGGYTHQAAAAVTAGSLVVSIGMMAALQWRARRDRSGRS